MNQDPMFIFWKTAVCVCTVMQASALRGGAFFCLGPPAQESHIWPKLWPPRPITPPSSPCLPRTWCLSGSARARSEFLLTLLTVSVRELQASLNDWFWIVFQTGEESVRSGSPAQAVHHLHRRGGLPLWIQKWERERSGSEDQDRVPGADAGWETLSEKPHLLKKWCLSVLSYMSLNMTYSRLDLLFIIFI